MNNAINSFIDNTVQCWGCGLFDRLFGIVSVAAATIYQQLVSLCTILFLAMFTVFVINAIWQNIKSGGKDPFYTKSIQKVIINTLVVFSLLGMGVAVPKLITRVTFEPVATAALVYTEALTNQNSDTVNERVTYQPSKMEDNGFYRPQLRDTIIMLMKVTITQFQSYMKLGIAVMDSAFTWKALLGIGALIKHIMLFVVGLYLFYGFFKLFVRFCFYFVDIIVAMAFFAFFFPISLMMMSFDGAEHLPKAVENIRKSFSKDQTKKLINAIVALVSCVITYTIIIVILAKFLSDPDETNAQLMQKIMSGEVFEADLSTENLEMLTLTSAIVLVYVLNFIYGQIPQISKMILGVFGVGEEKQLSEKAADDALTLSKNIINTAVKVGKTIISDDEKK